MDNNRPSAPSFSSQLIIAVIPIFLGTFLFAGVLESYKKDVSIQKELIKDYYRPMRVLQSTCHSKHNQLFLKYGEISGLFQLMYDEIEHMLVTPESKLGGDYEIIPMSIFETHVELKAEIASLKEEVDLCRSELFLKYEELALVTGTYPTFHEFSNSRFDLINAIYEKRKAMSGENFKDIDLGDLMSMVREFLNIDVQKYDNKVTVMNKLEIILEPTKKYSLILMETEQEIFRVDKEFSTKLHGLFSKEISNKHSNGFFSWLF
ncbi:MAG: hypothetical protein ACPGUE_12305 [Marinomonas sp.]